MYSDQEPSGSVSEERAFHGEYLAFAAAQRRNLPFAQWIAGVSSGMLSVFQPVSLSTVLGWIMERIQLPLSDLSLAQKLDLLESIWADLAKHEQVLDSPDWHEDVLRDREKAFAAGKISKSNWEDAKERIRRKVSCK